MAGERSDYRGTSVCRGRLRARRRDAIYGVRDLRDRLAAAQRLRCRCLAAPDAEQKKLRERLKDADAQLDRFAKQTGRKRRREREYRMGGKAS